MSGRVLGCLRRSWIALVFLFFTSNVLIADAPQISAVTPTVGRAGDQITLTGTGFGSEQGSGRVWLGNTYGAVTSWSDMQVIATIASGAKSGTAQVLQGGTWSNAISFTVITPNVANVTPTTGVAGMQVTFTGTGFGSAQGSGRVWLGNTYGVVASWSDTQIVATVASGAKSGTAQVLQGGVWSSAINFEVITPVVSNVTPTTGVAGTQVTFTGTGFGSVQGSGRVWLGNTYGLVSSWNDTQIVATVASGAKSGTAQVLQGGVWSSAINFEVTTPNVTSVTPMAGVAGTEVTFTGTGFGSVQGNGKVWLGNTYGVVSSWSDTQIVATVASGAKSGTAQVLQGGVWSSAINFEVTTPVVSNVTPTTGVAGTQVTFTGTGFGTAQGSGRVWLGNTYGVVASWSDTQIVATVASGAKSGTAQVLQGGVWSSAINFEVITTNVTSVTPTTGVAGTEVTFIGTGFGAIQGSGRVWLGNTYGDVTSWSDTQIVATVTTGAKSGTAQVLQGGVWSSAINFEVITPDVTSVTPTTGVAGTEVIFAGSGFGTTQGSGRVWLGNTYGVVANWSDTQIVATVASGAKSGTAQVLQGGVWSSAINFEVITPNVTSVTPTTGAVGTEVTFTGTGFGAAQGSGRVWLGNTYGVVTSWSDTQIVATVASGAQSGTAQVLQGGVWSNSVAFTVGTQPETLVSVKLTSPFPGTKFTSPESIDLEADVMISGATVSRVDFWKNDWISNTLIGSVTSAPYRLTWTNIDEGGYDITATVTDSTGAATQSSPVTVIVDTDGTTLGTLGEPIATPSTGNFDPPQTIVLAAQPGAIIHYTLDGSEPTVSSPVYADPISINMNTRLLARAFQDGWTPSPITDETYDLDSESPDCAFNVQSESISIPPEGETAELTVTASDPSCKWTAVSTTPWIGLTPVFNIGSMQLTYQVGLNVTQAPREADLTIAGRTIHFTQNGPAQQGTYQITPDKISLAIDDVRELKLVDADGQSVNRAIWSVDDPTIAQVNVDEGIFIHGIAIGQTTVKAETIYGIVTADVIVKDSLVPGDPVWSTPLPASPGDLYDVKYAEAQDPEEDGATRFFLETYYSSSAPTTYQILRATSQNGKELWHKQLTLPFVLNNIEQWSCAVWEIMADTNGGVLLQLYKEIKDPNYGTHFVITDIARIDGITGNETWRYESGGRVDNMTVRGDGIIVIVVNTPINYWACNDEDAASNLLMLDGLTGTITGNIVPLPITRFRYVGQCPTDLARWCYYFPAMSSLTSAPNGNVYLSLTDEYHEDHCGSTSMDLKLKLLRLSPEGAVSWTTVDEYTYSGGYTPLYVHVPEIVATTPDAHDGVLLRWYIWGQPDISTSYITEKLSRVDSNGNLYELPTVADNLVVDQMGIAYGISTDDQSLVAFDDESGETQWSAAGGEGTRIVSALAEPDGGVMVQNLTYGVVSTFDREGTQRSSRSGVSAPLIPTSDGLTAFQDSRQTMFVADAEPGGVWSVPEKGNVNGQYASPKPEIRVSSEAVTRGQTATFDVTGIGVNDIEEWQFEPGKNKFKLNKITSPPDPENPIAWKGEMAISGSVKAKLTNGKTLKKREIKVVKRTGDKWESSPVTANEVPNGTFGITLLNPPTQDSKETARVGASILRPRIEAKPEDEKKIDKGPNDGLTFYLDAKDKTTYDYIISPALDPSATYYQKQWGKGGFIGGAALRNETIHHEAGSTPESHYANYDRALKSPEINPLMVIEGLVGQPKINTKTLIEAGQDLLKKAAKEPCGGAVNYDSANGCRFLGKTNWPPYQPEPK